jgi:hypothetical protein
VSRPASPKVSRPASPKVSRPASPKVSRPASPKMSRPASPLPVPIPGVVSTETFEERFVVSRPSIEKYANTDILKKNPKITMEELSIILGVTKIHLPKIETRVENLPLPVIMKAASPKRGSKASSPKAKSPKRDVCKDIKIGGVPIKKEMISTERSVKSKPVYKNEELKEIARQLGVSTTGTKDQIVTNILKELENRGC